VAGSQLLLRRIIPLGTLLVVLGCVTLGTFGRSLVFPDSEQTLASAKNRWTASSTSHYRLSFSQEYSSPGGRRRCGQVVEVHDDTVVAVLQNSCDFPGWTVTQLFRQIGVVRSIPCVLYGCACDLVSNERIVYDPGLGYPRTIGASWMVRPNWSNPDYWKLMWSTGKPPRCAASDTGFSRTITVTLLAPIP
jgi:hypothetical protein